MINRRLIQELRQDMKSLPEFRGLDLSPRNVRQYLAGKILNEMIEKEKTGGRINEKEDSETSKIGDGKKDKATTTSLSAIRKAAKLGGYKFGYGLWETSDNIYSGWVAVKDGHWDNLSTPKFVGGIDESEKVTGYTDDKVYPGWDEWDELDATTKSKIAAFFGLQPNVWGDDLVFKN